MRSFLLKKIGGKAGEVMNGIVIGLFIGIGVIVVIIFYLTAISGTTMGAYA